MEELQGKGEGGEAHCQPLTPCSKYRLCDVLHLESKYSTFWHMVSVVIDAASQFVNAVLLMVHTVVFFMGKVH